MRHERLNARGHPAFDNYAPLVAALRDEAGCQNWFNYDAFAYDRHRTLMVEAKHSDSGEPPTADLVISIEVLDEIRPAQIGQAIDEIASITRRLALIVVHRTLANAVAGDPVHWLLEKIGARLDLVHFQDCDRGFLVLACPAGHYARLSTEVDFSGLARTAVKLAPSEPRGQKAERLMEGAKRSVELKWLALWDERTGWGVKALAIAAITLALSPIDLTPDVIPHVRYLDDLALLAFGTILTARLLSAEVIADLRSRVAAIDHARAIRGSFALGAIWVGAVLVALLHAIRPVV